MVCFKAFSARRLFTTVSSVMLIASGLVVGFAEPTAAAIIAPFAAAYSTNDTGAIDMIGNSLVTCPASASCTAALAGAASSHNGQFNMVRLDADTDSTTTSSSRSTLAMPAGSTVQWAGLYWGGFSNSSTRNQIKFKAPSGGYSTRTASRVMALGGAYHAFSDVTSLIVAGGNGAYWGADAQLDLGAGYYGGWGLVVVYTNPALPVRSLTVFDGFAQVRGTETVDIAVSGFLAPPLGTVNSELGVMAYEGDLGIPGDQLQLSNNLAGTTFATVNDAANPAGNFFNSTISDGGAAQPGQGPANINTLSLDIDEVNTSGILPNNATSATIRAITTGDAYYPGVFTFAVDLYAPAFPAVTKTVVDLNGGTALPGDVLEYSISMQNTGLDPADRSVLTDVLPVGVTLVPGSITYTAGAILGVKTDAAGDDQAEYNAGSRTVIARVGAGASATQGGSIGPNELFTVTFRTTVDLAAAGTSVSNTPRLSYRARTINKDFAFTGNTVVTPVPAFADVSVTKSALPSPAVAGSNVTWTVNVANAGPNAATDVVLNDPLPAGVTIVSASWPSGTCTGSTTITCALGMVPVGSTVPVTIIALLAASAADGSTLSNSASAAASTADQSPANNSASVATPVVRRANLSITKSATPSPLVPGASGTYTLTVTNAGPSDASSLTITDLVPSGFTPTSVSTPSGSCVLASVTCTLASLANSATALVTIVGSVDARMTTSLANTASVSAVTVDPVSANNSTTLTTPVAPLADVTITKRLLSPPAIAGQSVTWEVEVSNLGPSVARAVSVTDTLPGSVSAASATASIGSCGTPSSGSLVCSIGDLAPGASSLITLTGTVAATATGSIVNSATVTTTTPQPVGHQTDMASATSVLSIVPDLQLTKSVDHNPVVAGEGLQYLLTITNNGPSASGTSTITDSVPSNISITSATPTAGGTCGIVLQMVSCSWPSILPGASPSILIVGIVAATATSLDTNTASVATAGDPDTSNNLATALATVTTVADVSATKTWAASSGIAGNTTTVTIGAHNAGPSTAAAVSVSDLLPEGVTVVSAPGCTTTPVGLRIEVTCALGSLSASGSATAVVTVRLGAELAAGALSNTADASSTTGDPNPSDNSATAVLTVTRVADLAITKSVSPTPAVAGTNVNYTLTITNNGPSSATAASANDLLPVGLSFVSGSPACVDSSGNVSCSLGDLAPGASASISIVAHVGSDVAAGTVLTNNASASSATPDPTPAVATAPVTVSARADVGIAKAVSPATVSAGGMLTWTLTATNAGPSDAQTVAITDVLPAGVTLISVSSSLGSCTGSTTVACSIPTLPDGATATISIVARVASGASGSIANTVTISAATPEPAGATAPNSASVIAPVDRQADLAVTKTASVAQVAAGAPIEYSVTVVNNGPADATGVVLTDVVPADVIIDSVLPSSCSFVGATVTCLLGTVIARGAPTVITISTHVDSAAAAGSRTNTASATSTTPLINTIDDLAEAAVVVVQQSDLWVSKTIVPDPAIAGDEVTWTVQVGNDGPSVARDIQIVDALPPGIIPSSIVASTLSGACAVVGSMVTCDVTPAVIAVGSVVTVSVSGRIDPGHGTGIDVLANTASVSGSVADTDSANNTVTVLSDVVALADVHLAKSASPGVVAGGPLTWTITATNDGPSTARGVTVADSLPAGFTTTSISSTQGSCSALPCALGSVPPNSSATVTVVGTVSASFAAASMSNTATSTSTTPDPDIANNSVTTAAPVAREADLSVTKTASTATPVAGETFTYTLSVVNAGPSDATSVSITDPLPAGLVVVSLSPGCTNVAGTINCIIGTKTAGSGPVNRIITVRVPVGGIAGSALSNTASIASAVTDPNPSNNQSTTVGSLLTRADLRITKSATPYPVVPGGSVTYTIIATNDGPSDAQAVEISDPMPAGLTATAATSSLGSCTLGATVSCAIGTLGVGASATVSIAATVVSSATAAVGNTVSIMSSTNDPDASDNSATATTPLAPSADLSIVKSVTPSPLVPGQSGTYTLTVSNAGPSDAVSVSVTDDLPSGFTATGISSPSGSCVLASVSCSFPTLAVGATAILTIAGSVDARLVNSLVNSASVSAATADSSSANNSTALTSPVAPVADVTVTKRVVTSPVIAGAPVTWQVEATNSGPSVASSISVTDTLRGTVSAASATTSVGSCAVPVGSLLTCAIGDLAPGATAVILVTATLDAAATGSLDNSVAVTTVSTQPAGHQTDSASVTAPISVVPDLVLIKAVDHNPLVAGEAVVYNLALNNFGPSNSATATMSDPVPANITIASATATGGGSCNVVLQIVTCTWSSVAVGASPTVTITGTVASTATAVDANTATVSAAGDPDTANNSATAAATVTTAADLTVSKSWGSSSPTAGTNTTVALGVANAGPSTATGVVVSDLLPADVSVVTATGCTVTLVGTRQRVDCPVGSILASSSAAFTITVALSADLPAGILSNTASVASTTTDPNPSDNTTTAVTTVGRRADLTLTKTASAGTVVAGTNVTYSFVLTNAGPSSAVGPAVYDVLPLGLTFVSSSASCGDSSGLVTCDFPNLASGETTTFTVVAHVDPSATPASTMTNNASASSSTPDPTPATATAPVTIGAQADLAIAKALTTSPVVAGSPVTWTLVVSNAGPSDAASVSVSDVVPTGVTLTSATVTPGSCSGATTVTCTIASLPVGASRTITLTGILASTFTGLLSNTATVSAATPEPAGSTGTNSSTASDTSIKRADIRLSKTALPDPAIAGDFVTWTILVSNDGPSVSGSVRMVDDLPAGVIPATITASTPSGSCTISASQVECGLTPDVFPVGATATITVRGQLDPTHVAGVDVLDNVASVFAVITDPDVSDNTVHALTDVRQSADVRLTKTAIGSAVTGATLTWTITATNDGPSTAQGVTVSDSLPAAFVPNSISSSQGGCSAVPCVLGALAPGALATVTITGSIVSSFTATTLTNTATVTTSTPDPDPSDNSATGTAVVATSADLSVAKSASSAMPIAGETFEYTVAVSNAGPSDATAVSVTDPLPAGLSVVSLPAGCTETAATVTCSVGTLVAGTSTTRVFSVAVRSDVAAGTVVSNTATATSPVADPDIANNRGSVAVSVDAVADVSATKTASPAIAVAGEPITYTIVVSNPGPSDAQAVTLSDPLPIGLTALAVSSTAGTCVRGTVVTCFMGTVPAGGSVTVTLTVDTDPAMLAPAKNIASVTSLTFDPDASNNKPSVTTTLEARADVGITKTAVTTPLIPGTPGRYRLTVTNSGPSTARDVIVTDPLAASLTAVNAAATAGSCVVAPNVSCALGDVPPGATVTILVDVNVDPSNTAAIDNTATVTSTTAQPGGSLPDTASTSTPAQPRADLTVTKLIDHNPLVAGEPVSYTVIVTNNGPSDAHSVTLTDVLPSFIDASTVVLGGANGCSGTAVVSCAWPTMALNEIRTITISAMVASTASAGDENTVSVASADDPDLTNNTAAAAAALTTRADLAVTKAGPTTATAGTSTTYTIALANNGPSVANAVRIRDALPAGMTLVSTDHPGDCAASTTTELVCDFATLPLGTLTIVITVAVDSAHSAGPVPNVAHVESATPDDQPSNNSDTHVVTVERRSAVSIDKVAPVVAPVAGQTSRWTLTVSNAGPSTAEAVSVSDVLPVGLWFVSAALTGSSGACNGVGPLVSCSLGDIVVGGNVVIELDLGVEPWVIDGTSISNTATVSTITPDDPADNSSDAGALVERIADLAAAKSVSPASIAAGETATWTIVIDNFGPSDSQSADISDTLPSGFIATGVSSSQGSCIWSPSSLSCQTDTIQAGSAVTIVVVGRVSAEQLTDLSNTAAVVASHSQGSNIHPDSSSATLDVSTSADLHVTKVGSPNPAVAGEPLDWLITLSNSGPSVARNVQILDTLPVGFTMLSVDGTTGCTALPCALPAVQVGSFTVVVHGLIDANAASELMTNTVQITSDTPDPSPLNQTAVASIDVVTVADLRVSKSASVSMAGGGVDWTVTVENAGSSDAQDVRLVDHLPIAALHNVTWTPASSCTLSGADLTCELGTVVHGTATSVVITAVVNASYLGTSLVNDATVTSTTNDANPDDNTTTVTSTVTQEADLRIAKTGIPSVAGSASTWTIVITNFGSSDAQDVVVNDTLPSGFGAVSASWPGGTCSMTPTLSCALGVVPAATAVTVVVSGTIVANAAVGPMANTATVTSPTTDPTPADHSSTGTSDVATSADISITKTPDRSAVVAGEQLSWTITVSNAGPSVARSVVIADVLPAGFTLTAVTGTAGCTALPCAIGDLDVGSQTLVVTGMVSASMASGSLSNNATVTTGTADPDNTDHAVESTVTVTRQADLVLTKTGPATARWNTPADFEIVVINNGPSTAEQVVITDALPAGLSIMTAMSDTGLCTVVAASVSCSPGTLAVGQVVRVTVRAKVIGTGLLTNTATVGSTTTDASIGSNTAQATVQVNRVADLQLTKVANRSSARVGDVITYTITVTNAGPDEADAVAAIDELNSALRFVAARPSTGGFDEGTGRWSIGLVAVGAVLTMELDAKVVSAGLVKNMARVEGSVNDFDPDSNEAVASLMVGAKLPTTGAAVTQLLQVAVGLIVVGAVMILVRRRRQVSMR